MKTQKEIYKVNGLTFTNYSDACEYIRENNFRVTNTESIRVKQKDRLRVKTAYLIHVETIK
jgi:hypothetical protein